MDDSKDTALKTLRNTLAPGSVVPAMLDQFGLNLADSTDPLAELLEALQKQAQVPTETAETRNAVLKTLAALGVEQQSIRAAYQPFETALGSNAALRMVPSKLKDNLLTAFGVRGALPFMLVLDSQGIVRAQGYVNEEQVTTLIKELTASKVEDAKEEITGQ
jgi:hypothetical protein